MSTIEGDTPRRPLTLAQAGAQLRSWRALLDCELYGIDEAPAAAGAPPELMGAIAAGVLLAAAGGDRCGGQIDASSFFVWLLRQGAPASAPAAPRRRPQPTSRDIHPASAAAWVAFGDAWAPERVAAFLSRMHRIRLMLCDRGAGRVVLDAETLAFADESLKQEAAFLEAREALDTALRECRIEAYAADHGRILHAGDFSSGARLDILHGRFVADDAAAVLSPDWERAAAAADRIGAVRLSGADLIRVFGRRRSDAARRKRAAAALREMFEAWRRGERPRPKRIDWESGLGLELAGTSYAARVVWREVTSDPLYAAARKPGRPKNDRN